jgi:hypothetical protein
LRNDIVDDDQKSLSSWLTKHIKYAHLEAQRRNALVPLRVRIQTLMRRDRVDTRPTIRAILKDAVYPLVPFKPTTLFLFMYLLRLGFLDGLAGLRFCFYHAWFEVTVASLAMEAATKQSVPHYDCDGVR